MFRNPWKVQTEDEAADDGGGASVESMPRSLSPAVVDQLMGVSTGQAGHQVLSRRRQLGQLGSVH